MYSYRVSEWPVFRHAPAKPSVLDTISQFIPSIAGYICTLEFILSVNPPVCVLSFTGNITIRNSLYVQIYMWSRQQQMICRVCKLLGCSASMVKALILRYLTSWISSLFWHLDWVDPETGAIDRCRSMTRVLSWVEIAVWVKLTDREEDLLKPKDRTNADKRRYPLPSKILSF